MTAGTMPPGTSVSQANLTVFKQWISANFPAKDGDPPVPGPPHPLQHLRPQVPRQELT
jgi:hypothetical protein